MEPYGPDGFSVDEGVEEVLDVGRRRPQSGWRAALNGPLARGTGVVLVAGALVAALLTRHAMSGTPTAAPTTPQVSVSTTPVAASSEPRLEQVVRTLAEQNPGLLEYDRSSSARGACVLVHVGSAPQLRAAALIERTFTGFRVDGTARTIDEFGQLCELRLVARDPHGTTLVLRVVSPSQARADHPATGPEAIDIGGDSDGVRSVAYVNVGTAQGWSMLIGSVGPVADQPAAQDMQHLADDPAVRW